MEWMFNNAEGTGNALINDISRVAHEALHGGGGGSKYVNVTGLSGGILLTPEHSAEGSSQSVITDLDPSTNPLMTKGMLWINETQWNSGWWFVASMDVSRAQFGVAALGGKLYAVGGSGVGGSYLQTAEAYDPVNNSWNYIASMNDPRQSLGVAALGGKLYAVGGANVGGGTWLYSAEVYDPVDNSWNPIASMNDPRANLGVAALGGKLYAVGGLSSGGGGGPFYLSSVEVYDPVDNSWNFVASMNTARTNIGVAALGGKLYAVGGYGSNGVFDDSLDTVEVYDPVDNSWNPIASLNNARDGLGVAALGGKLYAMGGDSGGSYNQNVEVYDPADPSGGWRFISPMNTALYFLAGAALGGKLYAVGGNTAGGGLTARVEVYDRCRCLQMPQITHQGEDFYISHQRGGPKTFVIPHPEHEGKMLRHACLEAPTRGTNVYEYQITTTEDNQTTEIALPSYFKHINDRGRVYISPCEESSWQGNCGGYVNNNLTHAIIQTQKAGAFNIMVTGVRKDPQAIAYSATENIDAPIAQEDIPTK